MSSQRYPDEFKVEAVKQVTERGRRVKEVAEHLGVSQHSLYAWIRRYQQPDETKQKEQAQADEIRRLKAQLRDVTDERDILKKAGRVLRQAVRVRYAFIKDHERAHPVRRLCRLMDVHPSGYYAWKRQPDSRRQREDRRLLGVIKQSWLESGGVYGYRKIHHDLRDLGERCGKHRVARLMRGEGLKSQTGYRRRPGFRGGRPAVVAPNHLQQQFDVSAPNQAWVTDITYIRTHEGWLYLSVVLDLFSRPVVGWSMRPRMDRELAMNALMMAVWRRQPDGPVVVHSDQGSQFSSHDWQDFLKAHGLVGSMSRRGNCHDNAVAESFFQLLKRERIRRRIYPDREEARRDVFDYIELFYNTRRRHGYIGGLSPVEFEKRYFNRLASV
ncbi:IS3 family transposase [Guyparkeria halophila]|uniref:IS3 family transposase n=1 Tax=Guyparkeria halophila TaxID=47960 RepID=A0A6I6CZX0_9GAMM|nr:IS3 family transposase [Guyparkeria halophila]QGT78990.1 IS3 family transposase [Guyparkeria halophila]